LKRIKKCHQRRSDRVLPKTQLKQGSFYLNADLMKLLRTKSVQDDLSIAEVVRKLLLKHYFTEEELKELYLKNNF
jgi:hypothetical protein